MLRPRVLVSCVLVGLAALLGLASAAGFRYDAARHDEARRDAARVATEVLRSQVEGTLARTQDVAGLFSASIEVTRREFDRYAKPMLAPTGANAYGFAMAYRGDERSAVERALGVPIVALTADRALEPAPVRGAYLPVTHIRSATRGRAIRGLELRGDPDRGPSAIAALRTGRPQATKPLRFASTGKLGVVFFVPARDAQGRPLGVAFGAFHLDAAVDRIRDQLPTGTAFAITEDGTPFGASGRLHDAVVTGTSAAGREWRIAVSKPPGPR